MIQLIQMIQKGRTALQAPQKPSIEDRIQWVQRLEQDLQAHSKDWIEFESATQNLDQNFIQEFSFQPALRFISRSISEAQSKSTGLNHRPVGLISVVLPLNLGLRIWAERVIPALLAGNSVLVKTSSRSFDFAQRLTDLSQRAKIPEAYLQVTNISSKETGDLLTQHPAVRAVSFAGRYVTAEKILKNPMLVQKKWQVSKSTNNSAILLGETWTDLQIEELLKACFEGSGEMPWNIKKIFVPENQLKDFSDRLIGAAAKIICKLPSAEIVEEIDQQVQKIKSEQGKILCGGNRGDDPTSYRATLVMDLSHCSTFQQDELRGPVVLIAGVKYSHEAVKWANTGYLSNFAIIFGDDEKAKRLAEKLEVSQVLINRAFRGSDQFYGSSQQTAFGSLDFRVFGDFYSEAQRIDAEV